MIGEALKDFLRYVPSRALPALVALAAVPALTRLLTPSEYGRYTLALTAANLFVALTSSWITASAIRFVPRYEDEGQLGRGLDLFVALFLCVVSAGAAVLMLGGFPIASRGILPAPLVGAAIVLCIAYAAQDFVLGLLRSRRRVSQFTMLTSISAAMGYVLGVACAFVVTPSAVAVLAGFILATLMVLPLSAREALRGANWVIGRVGSLEAREVLRYGVPGLVSNALTWITSLSDRYILAAAHGAQAVGVYGATRDLSDKPLAALNTLFLLAATPVGIRVWERNGPAAARTFVTNLTRYYLLVVLPLAVVAGVLAKPLIVFLADPRYHDGHRLVPLVAAGALLAGLAARYTLGLHFQKRTDLLMLCYAGAAVTNLGLNLLLVPRLGYLGAAATNLTTYIVLLALVASVSRPVFAWTFPVGAAARVAGSGALMGVAVWLSTRHISQPVVQLMVGFPVAMVTYLLAIIATRVLEPTERAFLARLLRISR